MAEIKAAQVKELRDKTGAGMMECKSALVEADGDLEEAVKVLRKKGLAAASKKAGRITSEGAVGTFVKGKVAVVVEANCETDFVAQTEEFLELLGGLASIIADANPADVAALGALSWPGDANGHSVSEVVSAKIAKIGENISVRRFVRYEREDASYGTYVHGKGSIGVVVELKTVGGDDERWAELAKDIAMHVAAADPRFLNRDEVTDSDLDAEREIARDQAVKAGKPEQIVEKIVSGKMEKYYGETVLLEQPYIRDDSKTVGDMVAARAKELGGSAEVVRFTRFKLGEGLEKRSDDFAAEVMAQVGS